MKYFNLYLLILVTVILVASCNKNSSDSPAVVTGKAITSFALKNADGSAIDSTEVSVTITATDSVKVSVPFYANVTQLIPVIAINGKSISPASGIPQNFSVPVTYTVTQPGGNVRKVVVVLKKTLKDVVYVGSGDKNLYALTTGKGTLIWKYTGGGEFSYSDPIVSNGIVYAGNTDGTMYAVDAQTGALKWRYATSGGIESSAAVAGGIVYFGSDDGKLYAVDANTGILKWKYTTLGNVSSSPVVANNYVYFGSSDGNVYALNAKTDSVLWKYATGSVINQSSPVIANGALYIGARDGNLYAINTNDGQLKWKYSTGGISLEMSSPVESGGFIYVGGWYNFSNLQAGALYAINETNGNLNWSALANTGFSGDPFVTGNIVYIAGDDANLDAVDVKTGQLLWKNHILPNGAGPSVANGRVFVGGGGTGYIYSLDALSGAIKWQFAITNGLMTSTPCVIDANGAVIHR